MMPTDAEMLQPATAPKLNPRNNLTMFKIFHNVQFNVVQHKKYVKEMIKLYKKVSVLFNFINFSTEYWRIQSTNYSLI